MSPHGVAKMATEKEMMENRIDIGLRDSCAHLLIPLNKCRMKTLMMPWECQHDRHIYEKCQHEDFKQRVKMMQEQKSKDE